MQVMQLEPDRVLIQELQQFVTRVLRLVVLVSVMSSQPRCKLMRG